MSRVTSFPVSSVRGKTPSPPSPPSRILLVKTSSLGDVVHNLPVAADLARCFPGAAIDWCVEESFIDIPRLSAAVREAIPVALRRWRRAPCSRATWREVRELRQRLRAGAYDAVLDTQGLIKSAVVARLAPGRRLGYSAEAAREPLAARFYDATFTLPKNVHAVERNRWLAAAAFGYEPGAPLDYGVLPPPSSPLAPDGAYAILLTASSRDDKLWPEDHWTALGRALAKASAIGALTFVLPAGNPRERERAERLARSLPGAVVPPPLPLSELAALFAGARLAVGVDTGLTHLAAALALPTIALYTATDPGLTGVYGTGPHLNLGGRNAPPDPESVIAAVRKMLAETMLATPAAPA